MERTYDFILIGTGQATGTIVPELLKHGRTLAVVESGPFGGTCVNSGCTPTKTLVASARAAWMVRRAESFGIRIPEGEPVVDYPAVRKRMNRIRRGNSRGMETWLEGICDIYRETGTFLDDHLVQAGEAVLRGEQILIHTGTRSRIPDIPGIDRVPILDNRSILELTELPEHLVVVGGSYIALEFAQIFRRFGCRVSVIQRSGRILSREDEEIALSCRAVLEGEGIEIYCGTALQGLSAAGPDRTVEFDQDGSRIKVTGSHILMALGRRPETDKLNLTAAGVRTDSRGFIETDGVLRTSVPHIYALGDVNGRGAFTHTSVNDGQIFLDHLAGGSRSAADRIPIHSLFTDPPVARVGMTEKEAAASGRRVLKGSLPMDRISRAREKNETAGLMKVLVDREDRTLLGAVIHGTGGDEIINMLAVAMQNRLTVEDIRKTVLVHPTVGELIPFALVDLVPL